MVKRLALLGLLFLCGFGACASGPAWRYYHPDLPAWDGWLRGPEAKDDLPMNRCAPTAEDPSKAKCAVMLSEDMKALLSENDELKERIKYLEQACFH